MANPAKRPATYADIDALPPGMIGEIIHGVLYTQPRPSPRQSFSTSSLGDELVGPFQKGRGGPGGWIILDEPEIRLGPHTLVPDMAGWRRERMPKLPDTQQIEIVPSWICEFLSPRTEKRDRGEKRTIYATYGVDHYWLVDPRLRSLEVMQRQDKNWLSIGYFTDGDQVPAPPFDAITFDLGLIWAEMEGEPDDENEPPA